MKKLKSLQKFRYTVADYEHSGDLDHAVLEIKKICPDATDIKAFEEEDYEAEADYKSEYGELDEAIYQGYVEFYAPEKYAEALSNIDCYPIKS